MMVGRCGIWLGSSLVARQVARCLGPLKFIFHFAPASIRSAIKVPVCPPPPLPLYASSPLPPLPPGIQLPASPDSAHGRGPALLGGAHLTTHDHADEGQAVWGQVWSGRGGAGRVGVVRPRRGVWGQVPNPTLPCTYTMYPNTLASHPAARSPPLPS